jgi:hypothetical protein
MVGIIVLEASQFLPLSGSCHPGVITFITISISGSSKLVAQNYRVFGVCLLSSILKGRERNVGWPDRNVEGKALQPEEGVVLPLSRCKCKGYVCHLLAVIDTKA